MKATWTGLAIYDKETKDIVRLPATIYMAFTMQRMFPKKRYKIIKVKITESEG